MGGLDSGMSFEPDAKEMAELERAALAAMDEAQNVARTIVNEQTCKDAQRWANERMAFVKHIKTESKLARLRDAVHEIHAGFCKAIRDKADPHEIAVRKVVDPAILIFTREENRKRQELEDKQRAEAMKKEEDARLVRAEELAKQGKAAQADAMLSRPIVIPTAKIAPVDVKNVRKRWTVKPLSAEDAIALVKAIAGGAVPIQAIEINYSFLNKQAQLMDGHLTYPGVECQTLETLAHGRVA